MKFFRNMDEMELHLSLNAIRVAWFFTVMALFIWGIWDCVQTGRVTAPMYLLIFQNLLYFLALRVGRWRAGDRDGARSFLLYVPLLVVFLLAFGLLLRGCDPWKTGFGSCGRRRGSGRRTWHGSWASPAKPSTPLRTTSTIPPWGWPCGWPGC